MSLMNQGIGVAVTWIPGHIGVFGNEWADWTAKKAAERQKTDILIKLNKGECKTGLKQQLKNEWQSEWEKYNDSTMKKLRPTVTLKMPEW